MLFLTKPTTAAINEFIARQHEYPFSYREVGYSRDVPPNGYAVDRHRILLGKGKVTFEAACDALRRWEMFDLGWIIPCWPNTPIKPGAIVAVLAHCFGLWWLNATRIVYVIEEQKPIRKFGFAYGTLPDHMECGEERFTIEWDANDSVWYDLMAFSRPNHWLVWLAYPIGRWVQKRFSTDSLQAMARTTTNVPPIQRIGSQRTQ